RNVRPEYVGDRRAVLRLRQPANLRRGAHGLRLRRRRLLGKTRAADERNTERRAGGERRQNAPRRARQLCWIPHRAHFLSSTSLTLWVAASTTKAGIALMRYCVE